MYSKYVLSEGVIYKQNLKDKKTWAVGKGGKEWGALKD